MPRQQPTYEEFCELCTLMKQIRNEVLFKQLFDKMSKMGLPKTPYIKQFDYLIKAMDYLRQTVETECYKSTGKPIDCFSPGEKI